jgi:branched-chain amino acid transport system ATP-binding protein
MLSVYNLCKTFDGIKAVDDVSLKIQTGTITGLIGPNGAGKTTLFNVIAGHYQPSAGQVFLDGEDITGAAPHDLFQKGMLRTFQLAHEFASLTVRENLMMVPPKQSGESLIKVWLSPSKVRAEEALIHQRANDVIEFLEIDHLANEYAGNLSGGQKKLLELGRTMMTDAKIVFLDEVGAGVNRSLLGRVGDMILRLNKERNYTFCMIEHDMKFIAHMCNPVIVMAEGQVLAEGSAKEIQANNDVIEAYLGTGQKNSAHLKNQQSVQSNS